MTEDEQDYQALWDRQVAIDNGEAPEEPETTEQPESAEGSEETEQVEDEEKPDKKENVGKVLPAERAGFRAEKRKWREKAAAERQALEAERTKFQSEASPILKARELYANGDPEGAIKAAFGVEFHEFTQMAIQKHSGKDPRVERLMREREAEKAALEKARAEAQQQAQQAQQAQRQQAWAARNIIEPLKTSDDESLRAIAEDNVFVAEIFRIQRENYDETTDSTISLEEAVEEVREKYRKSWETLSRIYGNPNATVSEAQQGATQPGRAAANTKSRKARHVPSSRAVGASRNAPPPEDDDAFLRYAEETMNAAIAKEREERKAG